MSFDLKLENGNLKIVNGDFAIVTNTDKLIQDVLKMVLTPVGANKMHIWYGSNFGKTLIGTPLDLEFAKELAVSQLISSLEVMKTLQHSQAVYQNVSASEAILKVIGVRVDQDDFEPRFIRVLLYVMNRASIRASVDFSVNLA